VVNKAMAFRREQEKSLGWDCDGGCKHAQVIMCIRSIVCFLAFTCAREKEGDLLSCTH